VAEPESHLVWWRMRTRTTAAADNEEVAGDEEGRGREEGEKEEEKGEGERKKQLKRTAWQIELQPFLERGPSDIDIPGART